MTLSAKIQKCPLGSPTCLILEKRPSTLVPPGLHLFLVSSPVSGNIDPNRKSHRCLWSFGSRILAGRGETVRLEAVDEGPTFTQEMAPIQEPLFSEMHRLNLCSPGTIRLTKGETEAQRIACG